MQKVIKKMAKEARKKARDQRLQDGGSDYSIEESSQTDSCLESSDATTPKDLSSDVDWRDIIAVEDPDKKMIPMQPKSRYLTLDGQPVVLFPETCDDSAIIRNPKYATVNLDGDEETIPELQPGVLSKLLYKLKVNLVTPKKEATPQIAGMDTEQP